MKIAVVDDEMNWRVEVRKGIRKYLGNEKTNTEVDTYESGEEFLKQEIEYDIVFMDIEMGNGLDGFETIRIYKKKFHNTVISILTTHNELSRKGYMVDAFRYIDKTQIEEELPEALGSAIRLLGKENRVNVHLVNMGEIKIAIKDIVFIETVKRNVRIHTIDNQYVSNRTISSLENELKDFGFYLAHKSIIVNLDAIATIDHKERKVNFYNGLCTTIARNKIPELIRKYLDRKFEYGNS